MSAEALPAKTPSAAALPTLLFILFINLVGFGIVVPLLPFYGKSFHASAWQVMLVFSAYAIGAFFGEPFWGRLSDRIGRKPILIACTVAAILTAYPALRWLGAAPSIPKLLAVELWLAFLYAAYNGAMAVRLTEIMPPEIRTSGFSLAYSTATAIFGGFTPAISTWLIHVTGNRAMPGLWMSLAALCGLIAVAIPVKIPGKIRAPFLPSR